MLSIAVFKCRTDSYEAETLSIQSMSAHKCSFYSTVYGYTCRETELRRCGNFIVFRIFTYIFSSTFKFKGFDNFEKY